MACHPYRTLELHTLPNAEEYPRRQLQQSPLQQYTVGGWLAQAEPTPATSLLSVAAQAAVLPGNPKQIPLTAAQAAVRLPQRSLLSQFTYFHRYLAHVPSDTLKQRHDCSLVLPCHGYPLSDVTRNCTVQRVRKDVLTLHSGSVAAQTCSIGVLACVCNKLDINHYRVVRVFVQGC